MVDYGLGNLKSMERALVGADHIVNFSSDPQLIACHPMVILPGVGAFDSGMKNLVTEGIDVSLRVRAAANLPLIGICLGMQLLFEGSEEGSGKSPGLGVLPGYVRGIPRETPQGHLRAVPHVGWNELKWVVSPKTRKSSSSLFDSRMSLPDFAYFTHSFYAQPASDHDIFALTDVGEFTVCSVVSRGRTTGFQFHPEKSGRAGVSLLSDTMNRLLETSA